MEGTSYSNFIATYNKEQLGKKDIDEATGGNDDITEDSKTAADQMISKLCRVCGNRGQIYIFSVACDKYLTIHKSRLQKFKEVTIAEMIEKISSQKVEKSDSLPQFICPHCLSYLQHAYNVRLQIIHNTENLKEAIKIASNETIILETPSIRPLTLNQLEINEINEELESDKYWYENFDKKNVKIKIAAPTSTRIEQRKAEEFKCPGCFKKSYGARSHNEHMDSCLINFLKIFFSEFQSLYKSHFEKKITQDEYVFSAISLLFKHKKRIEEIGGKQGIEFDAVTRISPPIPNVAEPMMNRNSIKNGTRPPKDRYTSPADNGYYSNTH